MFIENKYTGWYNNIIAKAQARLLVNTYIEKHHIIPRCLGGTNNALNLVKLTAREHFICHLLLTKMTTGRNRHKMSKALTMIMGMRRIGERGTYCINGRWYEHARILAHKVRADYWTDEKRKAQSIGTRQYFATVDKTTSEYKKRGEGARQYNLNKVWTERAKESRLKNCLASAAIRKGTKQPDHSARLFKNYVAKNKDIFEKIWNLYELKFNRRQIAKQLNISWDRVNLAINKQTHIQEALLKEHYHYTKAIRTI